MSVSRVCDQRGQTIEVKAIAFMISFSDERKKDAKETIDDRCGDVCAHARAG